MEIKSLSPMESAVWTMKGALAGIAAVIVIALAMAIFAPERFGQGTPSHPPQAPKAPPSPPPVVVQPSPSLPVRQILSLDIPTPRGPVSQKVVSFTNGYHTCYMTLYESTVRTLSCVR